MASFDIGPIEEEYPGWSRWLDAHDAGRSGRASGHTGADMGDHAMACDGEKDQSPLGGVEVIIGNTARSARKLHWFEWTCFVQPKRPADAAVIASVAFTLHPTFSPDRIVVSGEAARENGGRFAVTRRGWGTFQVGVEITDCNGHVSTFSHDLSFARAETANDVLVEVGNRPTAATVSAVATPTRADRACTSPCGADESQPPRMSDVSEALMHGADGVGNGWNAPLITLMCDEEARPGYQSEKAHEYHDDNDTLHAKVKVLADKVRAAADFIVYTGAGISTASGISDYASKGKQSGARAAAAKSAHKGGQGLDAHPTLSHFVLTALHRSGYLKHWIQQNHDGLPQKAGYPQHALNEIHGAWFDPSNPVVPMDGHLRKDLLEWMEREENKSDLVLAMGTSLCGMHADMVVEGAARRRLEDGEGQGAVIVGFQRTRMDNLASLRIFAAIDEVMVLLARQLGVHVSVQPYAPQSLPASHMFDVPYGRDGRPRKTLRRITLAIGAPLELTAGPGKGFVGRVVETPNARHPCTYLVEFRCTREGSPNFGKGRQTYALGTWMMEEACSGKLHLLPVVNPYKSS